MTQVDKRATWIVVSIVPAIRVFIFPSLLNPLENLEETLELYFTVGQADFLEAFLVTLAATLSLVQKLKRSESSLKVLKAVAHFWRHSNS